MRWRILVPAALALAATVARADDSRCFGRVGQGRLEHGAKLPTEGTNFTAYSSLGTAAGRTHVHDRVAGIVTASYAALATTLPATVFVYGETGWASGGRFRPHRTHQNGLSVDFFVPVRDAAGRSVPLPTGPTNKLGYAIEFDPAGRFGEYTIDFPAIAEHLYQLHETARARGAGLALVILDPAYLPKVFATPRGPFLRDHVRFMKGQAWVRHDEHYHVDFDVPCEPLR